MDMKKDSKVYVVQNSHRWNRDTNLFEPKYDLSSAAAFGEIVHLLSPTASPFRPGPIVAELREKLRGYQDKDYLLLIGNPVLILAVGAIAAAYNRGTVNALQWSGKDSAYVPVKLTDLDPNI